MSREYYLFKLRKANINTQKFWDSKIFGNLLKEYDYIAFTENEFANISNKEYLQKIATKVNVLCYSLNLNEIGKISNIKQCNVFSFEVKEDKLLLKSSLGNFNFDLKKYPQLINKNIIVQYLFKKELIVKQIDNTFRDFKEIRLNHCNYINSFNLVRNMVIKNILNQTFLEKFDDTTLLLVFL